MQVTQLEHQNTHAIVGGEAAQAYGVNANAEFFEMLSSTLYPNKKLAAVREVLCNAWDAHLMIDRPDLDVEVVLDDKALVIRDFGPGISHEDIVPIYCTYGGSTKTHDGKQTGGFGLGSKAPYAVTKHFTVTSCNNGTRSVYAASRGSAETQGRPDFRRMVKVPCGEETGVTVTIPIEAEDHRAYDKLVRDLALLGGMNVKLNGEKLNRVDYDQAEAPFVLLDKEFIGNHHNKRNGIYLKYGAVVYPVDMQAEGIKGAGNVMTALLAENFAVVLLAEPMSVSVAPSRETLSYSTLTVGTIQGLLAETRAFLDAHIDEIRGMMSATLVRRLNKAHEPITLAGAFYDKKIHLARSLSDLLGHHYARTLIGNKPNALTTKQIIRTTGAVFCTSRTSIELIMDKSQLEAVRDRVLRKARAKAPWLKKYMNRVLTGAYYRRHHDYAAGAHGIRAHLEKWNERFTGRLLADHNVTAEFCNRFGGSLNPMELRESFLTKGSIPLKKKFNKIPVIFAPSRAAADRLFDSDRSARPCNYSEIGLDRTVLVIRIRKNTNIDEITGFLSMMGFTKFHDASTMVKPRPTIQPSKQLFMLTEGHRAWAPVYTGEGAKVFIYGTIFEPDMRSELGPYRVRTNCSALGERHIPWLLNTFGPVVIAQNSADVRVLEKAGLVNVMKCIAERFAALSENDMIGLAIQSDFVFTLAGFQGISCLNVSYMENPLIQRLIPMFDPSIPQIDLTTVDPNLVKIHNEIGASGGTMGQQYVSKAIAEFHTKVSERLKVCGENIRNSEFADLIRDIRLPYYMRNKNTLVLEAMIHAAAEAGLYQDRLKAA